MFVGCISLETTPKVPLKLEEDDDDRVVIGDGINFEKCCKGGALGLLYRLVFLLVAFFLP